MGVLTLPCRADPAATDITGGDRVRGATEVAEVQRVLGVAAMCNTRCLFVDLCLERATLNPPLHRCVMGGQIWEPDPDNFAAPSTGHAPEAWAQAQGVNPAPPPEGAKTCAVCPATFADTGPSRIYCSRRCKARAQEDRSAADLCEVCGQHRGVTRRLRRAHDTGCAAKATCSTCGESRGETVLDRKRHAAAHARQHTRKPRESRYGPAVERAEVAARMAAEGATVQDIADRLKVHPGSVERYLLQARRAAA